MRTPPDAPRHQTAPRHQPDPLRQRPREYGDELGSDDGGDRDGNRDGNRDGDRHSNSGGNGRSNGDRSSEGEGDGDGDRRDTHARLARGAALTVAALLPLAAWPGLERPFSTPKLYLLVGAVLLLGPSAWRLRRRAGAPAPWRVAVPLFWIASWTWSALLGDIVSPEALLLGLGAALFALILIALDPSPKSLAGALVCGTTGVAAVAAAQWAGIDPFALAGWIAPITGASPRMRVYATLGNPNFVAATLTAAVPLTIGLLAAIRPSRTRSPAAASETTTRVGMATDVGTTTSVGIGGTWRPQVPATAFTRALPAALVGALGLQFVALAATGSRAGALGLVGAAAVAAIARAGRGAAIGLAAALLLVALSPARPLGDTLAGRLYIWQTVRPHLFDAPVAGRGPGAFELLHPGWERQQRIAGGRSDAGGARFGGPQQHAHNDYLEALIERGLPGPVTIFAVPVTILALLATSWTAGGRMRRRPISPLALGAAASVTAMAAAACVDFPLARPTELTIWWSVFALAGMRAKGDS